MALTFALSAALMAASTDVPHTENLKDYECAAEMAQPAAPRVTKGFFPRGTAKLSANKDQPAASQQALAQARCIAAQGGHGTSEPCESTAYRVESSRVVSESKKGDVLTVEAEVNVFDPFWKDAEVAATFPDSRKRVAWLFTERSVGQEAWTVGGGGDALVAPLLDEMARDALLRRTGSLALSEASQTRLTQTGAMHPADATCLARNVGADFLLVVQASWVAPLSATEGLVDYELEAQATVIQVASRRVLDTRTFRSITRCIAFNLAPKSCRQSFRDNTLTPLLTWASARMQESTSTPSSKR